MGERVWWRGGGEGWGRGEEGGGVGGEAREGSKERRRMNGLDDKGELGKEGKEG